MALPAILTEEEYTKLAPHLASEAVKALGVEYAKGEDGRYVAVVAGRDGYALENVQGLRSSVEASRAERDAAQAILKRYGELKPEDVAAVLDKARKFDGLDGKVADAKRQFEEWREEHAKTTAEQTAAKVAAVAAERDGYRSQLEQHLIVGQATQILADPQIKGNPALLLPIIRDTTDAVEEQGEDGRKVLRVRVLNPAKVGRERIGKSGGPMTLEELVGELRLDSRYAAAFEGSGSSGGGTPPGGGGRTDLGGFPANRSKFTLAQKVKFVSEHGQKAFLDLPE